MKIILLDHRNNYVEYLSDDNECCKKFEHSSNQFEHPI